MGFFVSRKEKCYRQLWIKLGNKYSLSSIVRTLGMKGYTSDEISYAINKVSEIMNSNFNKNKREWHSTMKELDNLKK